MKAVLFVSHGSRIAETKREVQNFVKILKRKSGIPIFKFAFLEIESPSIPEGIEECIRDGATELILLLNFLNTGRHVDIDIPRIVKEAQAKHPQVKFRMTKPIGQHSGMVDLFLEMIPRTIIRARICWWT